MQGLFLTRSFVFVFVIFHFGYVWVFSLCFIVCSICRGELKCKCGALTLNFSWRSYKAVLIANLYTPHKQHRTVRQLCMGPYCQGASVVRFIYSCGNIIKGLTGGRERRPTTFASLMSRVKRGSEISFSPRCPAHWFPMMLHTGHEAAHKFGKGPFKGTSSNNFHGLCLPDSWARVAVVKLFKKEKDGLAWPLHTELRGWIT